MRTTSPRALASEPEAPEEESAEPEGRPQLEEQRVVLHGRSWGDYVALLAMRGESAVPRITYLEGEIELMSPGILHEDDKTKLARILESWAEESGQSLEGFGMRQR